MADSHNQSAESTGSHGNFETYGWFRAMRHPDALKLIEEAPMAYVLAAFICHRAQYRDGFNRHNLAPGEALLGDYATSGMTEQQYRTAKAQLAKWNFATFRATNKGTIGRLTDSRLFSIFRLEGNDQNHKQPTDSQRPKQRTANDPANDFQDHKIIRTQERKGECPPISASQIAAEKEIKEIRRTVTDIRSEKLPKAPGRLAALLKREDELLEILGWPKELSSRISPSNNPRNVGTATDPAEQGRKIAAAIERRASAPKCNKEKVPLPEPLVDNTPPERVKELADAVRRAINGQ